ncbi:MAG: helix-turn-helix transcriptional regulator [Negativicutes bacterium]
MLCDTIRVFRLERGISTYELGKAVGVSQEAIENYEANRWQPGLPTLKKLAQYFEVTVEELRLGLSLVYDDKEHDFLVVQNMGGNQIKVIGRTKEVRQ